MTLPSLANIVDDTEAQHESIRHVCFEQSRKEGWWIEDDSNIFVVSTMNYAN
jgi:hypothetical protein